MKLKYFTAIGFARDETGTTMIEYGLIVALIVIGLIASISYIGQTFVAVPLNQVTNSMNTGL